MSCETMPNWLYKRAMLTPDRIALRTEDEAYSFSQLDKRAGKTARRIARLGVTKGDHVALLLKNSLNAIEIIHALEYLGAVMVLLNNRLTADELAWQLNDSHVKCMIFDQEDEQTVTSVKCQYSDMQTITTVKLFALPEIDIPLNYEVDLNQMHTIIYTSGTTGKAKGVMLTYGNHWWSAIGSALNLGLAANDCWLLCVPIFHVSGLSILMRSIIYGITVEVHKKFEPDKVNKAIQSQRVTIISVVSVMLLQMLNALGNSTYPHTLRCVLLGGGAVPQPLLEQSKQRNIPVFQTYGMTETASQVVTLGPEYLTSKLGSAGKPLFPAMIKVVSNGVKVKVGQVGEIVVKGPSVTKGYYQNPEETLKVIKAGWLYTGDLGYLDEDGFLFVLDRRNDLIISGGENVYPAEIEAVLLKHSAVEEVGVAGQADNKWGKVPIAFVKLKPGHDVKAEELLHFCQQRLAKYKVPAAFIIVDHNLPRNAANKLLRRKLLDLLS